MSSGETIFTLRKSETAAVARPATLYRRLELNPESPALQIAGTRAFEFRFRGCKRWLERGSRKARVSEQASCWLDPGRPAGQREWDKSSVTPLTHGNATWLRNGRKTKSSQPEMRTGDASLS